MGHYSPVVRREALVGLGNLFDMHVHLLGQAATLMKLLDRLAPRFSDQMAAVRAAARTLLSAVISRLTERQFTPFFPLCLAHTCRSVWAHFC